MSIDTVSHRLGRLALVASILTFLLIVIGGIVRVSNSGLGCGAAGSGTHGWPLCNGGVLPKLNINTVIEYSHRTVAGLVLIAVMALVLLIYRYQKDNRRAFRLASIALIAVLAQAALGGLTVEHNLQEVLVATHLVLALTTLAFLLALHRTFATPTSTPISADRRLKTLVLITGAAILLTIGSGGYMAGTEGHGRGGQMMHHDEGAHEACGREFPQCNGSFLPFGQSHAVDIQVTHRAFMYLTALLILILFLYILLKVPQRQLRIAATIGVALLTVQILLGALNVLLEESGALITAHLAVATLLWTWIVSVWMYLVKSPQRQLSPRLTSATVNTATT